MSLECEGANGSRSRKDGREDDHMLLDTSFCQWTPNVQVDPLRAGPPSFFFYSSFRPTQVLRFIRIIYFSEARAVVMN